MKLVIKIILTICLFIGFIPAREICANEENATYFGSARKLISLDDIAWEDLTYKDIFVMNNLAYFNGFDEKSFEPYVQNTGNPYITNELKNTGGYSLEIKGTKPQQIKSIHTLPENGNYFIASKGYVTRYVQGILGICIQSKTNTIGHTNVTNGFETTSGILYGTTSDRIYIGSINGADLDGYIDDTVVVNMNLFKNKPTVEELTQLYENYVTYDKSIEKEEIKYTDQEKYNAFISYMNGKAKSLGMSNSTFKDSVGMNNLTTASDLAKLVIVANSYERMKGIWNNPSYSVNVLGKNARVYDVSLSYYSSEILNPYTIAGVKGGSLTKGNIRNLAVILDIPNSKDQLVIVVLYIDGGFNDREGALEIVKQLADLSIDNINNDKDISNIDVACQSAISIHIKENGETSIVYSKNENDIKTPASITKVLTAISVLDLQEDLNEIIEYKTFDTNIGGFYIKDFLVGDQVTTYDALQALMIASSNSTAQALARVIGEKILDGCEQGHDYETTIIQPTCTNAGYRTQTCKRCYHNVNENLEALGHEYEIIQGYNATFNEDGLTDGKECKHCGDTIAQQVIPMITPSTNLPSEFTYVKYLDSIGNAYIDTGIYALENDKFILYGSTLLNKKNHSLMGSGTSDSSNDRVQVHYSKNDLSYSVRFKGTMSAWIPTIVPSLTSFVLDLENNIGYINGQIAFEDNLNVKPSNNTIYLFSKNVNGTYDPTYTDDTRIYGYKHYRDGELLRDMIPCFRNSDYVYGMYDLVENKFYENAGQGSFSYDELNLKGKSGIVLNADTNEIYYGKNLNWKQAMASTTKIMTCILAIENLDLNSRTLKTIQSDLVGGTTMGLVVGESLTVKDALYGLMLPSGNDAAQLLARTVAGDYDSFLKMMNQKAQELGMINTYFSNASGRYDEGLYSSVVDMTTLMKYAMQNETFAKVVSTANYTIQADSLGARYHKLTNTNQLLTTYDGCIGGKTGTTNGSGAHLVVVARRHGTTLIAMILGSDSNNRYSDARKLLDYGFEMAPNHIYEEKVVEPTCTEQGYTLYSCECGESYKDNYVDALEHSFTNYVSNYDGTKTSKCDYCDETNTISDDYLLGDVNNDSKVNQLDRLVLSRHLAKWNGYESINPKNVDVNLDGKVNQLDRLILSRHLAKWQGYETLPYTK